MSPEAARLFTGLTLALAACSALIVVLYLVRRPPLTGHTKLWLLVGIGVLPLGASLAGSYAGIEHTRERAFCASCHTMAEKAIDAADEKSTTLASIHSRNRNTGRESCYACHQDYQPFGAVATKLNGMRHLYEYYAHYQGREGVERAKKIHLYRPYPNANCTQCHSTRSPRWGEIEAHKTVLDDLRSESISCVSCHQPVHPGKDGAS